MRDSTPDSTHPRKEHAAGTPDSTPPRNERAAGTPEWKAELKQRLAARRVDPTLHFSVVEELAQHLEDRYQSLIARGLSAAEAEQSVLQELEDDDALERELQRAERALTPNPPVLGAERRGSRRPGLLESWWHDVRYAARALRKSPGFTAVAVITLALGVGANTAIFSVVNAVMLRPLPFAEPDRLIRVWESNPDKGWPTFAASHPNFLDWRAQAQGWDALAAVTGATFSMTSAEGAQIVRASSVSADFLAVLGVTPSIGRNFRPEEDRPGGETRVAILTDGFWRRTFGADPAVLSRTVSLNAASHTIIGVLPPSFDWGPTLDLLVPLAADPARSRGDRRLTVIGRLESGVTLDQARTELTTSAGSLAQQYPASNEGWTVRLATFYDWIVPEEIRRSLVVLMGAVGLVLLIACGNVANLLLARGAVRQKELSIRVALGAERWRIVRQLLTESVLLAVLAAMAGLAVAAGTTRLLVAYAPDSVPRLDEVSFDLNVLGFALGISFVAAFIFGLAPAIQISRQRPADALRDETRGASGGLGRQRLRGALTIAEVALSVALLIGAGLLLRSFGRLQQVDPGFEVGPLMTMRVTLPRTSYATGAAMAAFYERLLPEIRSMSGVVAAASTSGVPLSGGGTGGDVTVPGRPARAGETRSADWRLVSPGYFAAMGIPLKSGRDFSASDRSDTPPVAIISESMARRFWPDEDPVGKPVVLHSFGNAPQTVIGVVGDVRSYGLDQDVSATAYGSAFAYGGWNPMHVVWRSAVDPSSHVSTIREAVRRIDSSVPLYDIRSLTDLLGDSFGPRRFNMYLLGVFAGVALLLAAIGLFGVMAYLVSQRTREIGVRLALGADRSDIFKLILGRGVILAVVGALIGVAGALWLTRVMQSLLFSVSATDPSTFTAVPILLVLVAILACYVPARRAMKVDPVTALRAE